MIAMLAGRVVVETLNVVGMLQNRRLARAIADAGMVDFLAKLECKSGWYGAEFVKADPWFPSSRICSACSWKNTDLMLGDRSWTCVVRRHPWKGRNATKNLEQWSGSRFPASGRGDV